MITPTYLAKLLVRMGYAIDEECCKRRLTDWRQKGLLPPLKVKGRQHHGKIYYWDNPEIAAQAVTVCKLFELNPRSEWVILSTWFAGYDVSPNKVRDIWKNNLHALVDYFKKQMRQDEEMGDVLSRLDRQILRQHSKKLILRHEYFISLLTNAFFNPDFCFDDFEDEVEIRTLLIQLSWPITYSKDIIQAQIWIKNSAHFLNKHCSLTARYELIKNCSDQNFVQVHCNWQRAKKLLRWLTLINSSYSKNISKDELKIMVFIGNIFIILNLVLSKLGYGSKFENALNELCDYLYSMNIHEMRYKIEAQKNSVDEDLFSTMREQIKSVWEKTPMDKSEEILLENYEF